MDDQPSPPQAEGAQHATMAVNTAGNEISNATNNAYEHQGPAQLRGGTSNSSAEQGNSAAVATLNARGTSAPILVGKLKAWTVHKSMGMTIGSNKLYGSSVAYVLEGTMKSLPGIELISMSRSIQHSPFYRPQGRGSPSDASRRSSYSLVINWNIERSMTNQRSPEEELQLNSARVQEGEQTCVVVYGAVLEFVPRGENC